MGEYLVLPRRHHLIPLAWRLKSEGHVVGVLPRSDRYERAWDGVFDKAYKGQEKRDPAEMAQLVEMAKAGQFTVLTDCEKWQEMFGEAERIYGVWGPEPRPSPTEWRPAPVQVGAFRLPSGEDILPHLLIRDLGVWPGGMGPKLTGAVLSEWFDPRAVPEFWRRGLEGVEARPGLWQRDLTITGSDGQNVAWGEARVGGWEVWQSQLLLAQVESLGDLLEGKPTTAKGRFAAAVAVSVPPWPVDTGRSQPLWIMGPAKEQRSLISWFDVRKVGEQRSILETAELDGLVAIVRASGSSIQWAGAQVLEIAQSFEMPEIQYRPDIGGTWNTVLAQLGRWGLV